MEGVPYFINPIYPNNQGYPNVNSMQNWDIRNLENRVYNLEKEVSNLKNRVTRLEKGYNNYNDNYSTNYQPNSYNMM